MVQTPRFMSIEYKRLRTSFLVCKPLSVLHIRCILSTYIKPLRNADTRELAVLVAMFFCCCCCWNMRKKKGVVPLIWLSNNVGRWSCKIQLSLRDSALFAWHSIQLAADSGDKGTLTASTCMLVGRGLDRDNGVMTLPKTKDGSFPVSANSAAISNPFLLSSSETGINPGIKSWRKHLSDWDRCKKAIGGVYFTKKWRAETLQPGLEFDDFKPWFKTVSSNASSRWTVRFFLVMIGVFWKREWKPF